MLSKKIPDSHINIDVEFGEDEGQFSLKKLKKRAEARKQQEKVTHKISTRLTGSKSIRHT